MSGNTTTSNNFTGLYGASAGTVVPTTPYGNANVVSLLAVGTDGANTVGNIVAAGNVTANYFLGNGSQLTGIASSYGNANVTALLANLGANTISTTGTITAGNITGGNLITTGQVTATGNIATAGYFLGTFAGNISGNLTVPGANTQVIFNNNGNAGASAGFTFDSASNVMSVTGNAVGGNLLTSGAVSAGGNVTAAYVIGNGSLLTNITGANVTGTVANATFATSAGTAQYVTANAQANITSVGVLTSLSASGNVDASAFNGSGAGLTSIPAGNITGQVANALVAGTVYTPAQPNITSVGTLTSLSVSGNITGANLAITTDAVIQGNLTVNGNTTFINSNTVTINDKFINVANNAASAAAANGGGLGVGPVGGEYATLTYNSTANAWNTSIAISATGNVSGDYFIGNGSQLTGVVATGVGVLPSLSVTGNTQTGNLLTGGLVSATGNIAGNYFIGNGSQLTGIAASYGNANVSNFLANGFGSNTITTTGNITAGNMALGAGNLSFGTVIVRNFNNRFYTGDTQIDGDFSVTGGANTTQILGATGNINTPGAISATGNITGGNIRTVGEVTATGNVQGGNILTAGIVSVAGNVTANNASLTGNLSFGTVVVRNNNNRLYTDDAEFINLDIGATLDVNGTVSASGNVTGGNILTVGQVSATGNVTGAFIIGNGSQLTGITNTYGNANVSNFLANGFGSNTIVTTGNITANNMSVGNNITLGGTVTIRNFNNRFYTGDTQVDANLTITGGANTVTILGGTGNITTPGLISATGNITGNYFFGNGSQLTGIAGGNATPGGAANSIQFNSGNTFAGISDAFHYTSNGITEISKVRFSSTTSGGGSGEVFVPGTVGYVSVVGNIFGGNIATAGVVTATGTITGGNLVTAGVVSATGNVSGNFFIGNGSQLTGIAGGYGNANVATFMAAFGSNTISTTGTITSGNITATNLVTTGASGNVSNVNYFLGNVVSATGNITGNYFVGNGSALTGISGGTPGGANTQIQFNDASAFAGNANLTFNNTTGNVNLGNLIITTSNATNFLNTVTPAAGIPANVTTFNSSQIIIGNGWAGNLNVNNQTGIGSQRGSKLFYWDTIPITDSGGPRVNGIGSNPFIQLQGNISNTNTRLAAMASTLVIGGTANNYQYTTSSQFAATGVSTGVVVGQGSTNTAIGNTAVTNMVGVVSNMNVNGSSNVGNSSGIYTAVTPASTAYLQTGAGLVIHFAGNPSVASDNVFGVYMNGNTSQNIFGGITNTNGMRKAANYYFLRNDDNLAQNKLGSLRLFNEYQYDNTSSAGTLTVDKNNGQVQSVVLTEAITTVTFSNFVTSASDGTTTDYQTDTVTLILRQGATPYAVTMPTGSAYRYAAGSTTVGATANTTTMISVTANYDSISAADQYLITISPEFS